MITMKLIRQYYLPILLFAAVLFSGAVQWYRHTSVEASALLDSGAPTIIVDAGHGGEDGGASTSDGIPESQINLQIAHRLNAMLWLVGYDTIMVRTQDVSIYSDGAQTIAQKKISDLKNRVSLVEQTENAILVSIHQNTYPEKKYTGAQVFSAPTTGSDRLAALAQDLLTMQVDTSNNRKSKQVSQSVYLMNQISCPAILAECGFLSNDQEAERLQTKTWQTKLAAALCCAVNQFTGETYGSKI